MSGTSWYRRLLASFPSKDSLLANRWLRWLRPYLDHPKLWHWSRRRVALGMAIGCFIGLIIPVAQIPFAAAVAIVLRANLPSAVSTTFITNPFTVAPIYYGAYRLGLLLTGGENTLSSKALLDLLFNQAKTAGTLSFSEQLAGIATPLFIGLFVIAMLAGLIFYLVISLVWYIYVWLKRRRTLHSR